MVGISGASERRWALTRPRILTFPSRQSGSDTLMLSMPSAMSPARMPGVWGVQPRYGTMVKLVPAIMLRSPTLTCEVGVLIPIWKVPGLAFFLLDQLLDRVDREFDVSDHRRGDERDQRDRDKVLER